VRIRLILGVGAHAGRRLLAFLTVQRSRDLRTMPCTYLQEVGQRFRGCSAASQGVFLLIIGVVLRSASVQMPLALSFHHLPQCFLVLCELRVLSVVLRAQAMGASVPLLVTPRSLCGLRLVGLVRGVRLNDQIVLRSCLEGDVNVRVSV
jgi:hypothetical protein